MEKARKLKMIHLQDIDHLAKPDEFDELTMESSAIEILTDFKRHIPLVIDHDVDVLSAERILLHSHTMMRLVVNDDNEFIGVLTRNDLNGIHISERIAAGIKREDILVKDVMTLREDEMAITYKAVKNATIADVVYTLQENGQEHCLVVDDEAHLIRGIISAFQIARMLHQNIKIERRPTFLDLFHTLTH